MVKIYNFDKILQDKEFVVSRYYPNLALRLVTSSSALEGLEDNYDNEKGIETVDAELQALNYALSKKRADYANYKFLDYVCNIEKRVTSDGNSDVFTNFRNRPIEVLGSKVERSKPYNIRADLVNLIGDVDYRLTDYNAKLKESNGIAYKGLDDELYNIEASCHIRFLRIHPFEDGNGRTARIILTKSLLDNGKAPCIIEKDHKREYCDYIENNDIDGMTKFLKKLSTQENIGVQQIYNSYLKDKKSNNKVLVKK